MADHLRAKTQTHPLLVIAGVAILVGICVLVGLIPLFLFVAALIVVSLAGIAATYIEYISHPARARLFGVTITTVICAGLLVAGYFVVLTIGGGP